MKTIRFILLLLCTVLIYCNTVFTQCSIDIVGIIDNFQNGGSLIAEGTASASCGRVEITLTCPSGNNSSTSKIVPVVNGNWEVEFFNSEIRDIKCRCEWRTELIASCVNGNCSADSTFILCRNEPCPTVDISVVQPTCQDKDTNGNYDVEFTISAIGGNFTGYYDVTFGDGTPSTVFMPPTNPLTVSHIYTCPTIGQDIYVNVTGAGCTSQMWYTASSSETFQFPDCGCPAIDIVVEPVQGTNCEFIFTAEYNSCINTNITHLWNFGDNTTAQTPSSTSPPHQYQDGSYVVTVSVIGIGNNCSHSIDLDVTNCDDCVPDCENKQCGDDDGCGGICNNCPEGETCVDGICEPNSIECNWWDPRDWFDADCWSLCFFLALLAFVATLLRLLYLAYSSGGLTWPITFTLSNILNVMALGLIVFLLTICFCEVLLAVFLAGLIVLIIMILALLAGQTPNLSALLLTMVLFAISGITYLLNCL